LPDLQQERQVAVVATLASALVGATLFILLLFSLPRPAIDWMRFIVPQSAYPEPADVASRVALIFIVVALLIWLAALGARWLLRRFGVSKRITALAVLLILAFAASSGIEAMSQLFRASGNLTASDARGLIIDDGRLTLHGWETIARRAAVASLYTAIMAAAFWLVRRVLNRKMGRV
jgi:hypothetical protein